MERAILKNSKRCFHHTHLMLVLSEQSAVEETELDDENDRTVYSVKIVKGNQELEVKVDALTEEVMKVEQD
jgi:uncharacterized membrane protein YkoI